MAMRNLTALIAVGRNGGESVWGGKGIVSSMAAEDTEQLTGLGIILNQDESGNVLHGTFAGQSVEANCILVKYTLNGDADLNGVLDASDYFQIDKGFLSKNSAAPLAGMAVGRL